MSWEREMSDATCIWPKCENDLTAEREARVKAEAALAMSAPTLSVN